ncbi:hypothetical protein [Streptomyces sp. NPDC059209]|uniref:hypothetical protein n=1 Tax=Streptomyces sp. NPDC059209 TaxID=3346769 RepID=UPI0036CABB1D
MTHIEAILGRALLTRNRTVPRDIVPPAHEQPTPAPAAATDGTTPVTGATEAAADLRALCETLVSHTSADDVDDFVTDKSPNPAAH